jgi:hypothetical protein
MNFIEIEYHSIIEEYINDYTDEKLSQTQRDTFQEVLISDANLPSLTLSAKQDPILMRYLGY